MATSTEIVNTDPSNPTLDQGELDLLLRMNGLLDESTSDRRSLVDEIKIAILDSGKLNLREWRSLRERLAEIELLIPTIDTIIRLKSERGKTG